MTQRHAAAGGRQLSSVVQRLQRYNQQNAFKRTILDMMANELLRRHLERLEEEDRALSEAGGDASVRGGAGGSLRGGGGGGGELAVGSFTGGGSFIGGSLRGGGGGGDGALAVGSFTGGGSFIGGSLRGGAGGSMRGGGGYPGGSLRGSMTALEALRRARERRVQVEAAISEVGL